MNVCMYVCMYVCVWMCVCVYVCTLCVCMCACMYASIQEGACKRMKVQVYMSVSKSIIGSYAHANVCLCGTQVYMCK